MFVAFLNYEHPEDYSIRSNIFLYYKGSRWGYIDFELNGVFEEEDILDQNENVCFIKRGIRFSPQYLIYS